MVRDGVLITPPVTDDILEGVTRGAIIELATDAGVPTEIRSIDRSELYVADEVFLCGTGVQVSPVVEVDHRPVGSRRSRPDLARDPEAATSTPSAADAPVPRTGSRRSTRVAEPPARLPARRAGTPRGDGSPGPARPRPLERRASRSIPGVVTWALIVAADRRCRSGSADRRLVRPDLRLLLALQGGSPCRAASPSPSSGSVG